MADFFSPNGNGLKVDMSGDYDPGITEEIDRQIRHLPVVVARCMEAAATLKNSTGSQNFGLVIQARPDTRRPRVYVVPTNEHGIHEELSQAVLLKAALGMAGK